MRRAELDRLTELFREELTDLGYELIDCEYVREGRRNVLRFFIYKEGGIGIDDCETVSKYVDGRLDELDPISEPYYLEVSSPDLNRPLVTTRDFERNLGETLDLSFYQKIDGEKSVQGVLKEVTEDEITLEVTDGKETKTKVYPRKDLAKVTIAILF